MVWLLIALLAVALVVVVGVALRLYRIERLDPLEEDGEQPEGEEGEFPAEEGEIPEDGELDWETLYNQDQQQSGAESGDEMMDLDEFFAAQQDAAQNPDEYQNSLDQLENMINDAAPKKQSGGGQESAQEDGVPDMADWSFDRLSSLGGGYGFRVDCQKQMDESRAQNLMYAAVSFDFDRFRFINSLKGYSIGDYVLSRMAQDMQELFPEGAMCSRVSADHFAVLFPMTEDNMFEEYYEGLKRICEKTRIDLGLKSGIRVCMGVAITSELEADYDMEVLLQKANIARFCLKAPRSDDFELFSQEMVTTFLYGRSALEDYSENQFNDDFVIYYQPITDTAKNKIIAYDALARWECEEDSYREELLTAENGRLPTNGIKVLYHVCMAMSRWRKAGREFLPVYVPLPVLDLFKQDIDVLLARCLSEFQLEPQMLYLTVPAVALRLDWTVASHQIKKLRDMGVKVGIDGITKLNSSLTYAEGLSLSFVKLHKSFAKDVDRDEQQQAQISQMLQSAGTISAKVVLEGVDNQEQTKMLKKLGCTRVQGKYCGSPQSSDDMIRFLPEHVSEAPPNGTVILDEADFFKGNYMV